LDADSAYADVDLHGEGLTSLQYREEKGATTHEIQANLSAPRRLQLEKRSDPLQAAGGSIRVPIHGTYYVGIGVCSHEKDLVEKAVFTNVALQTPAAISGQPALYSSLETIAIDSTDRRVVYIAPGRFEAPNWSRDAASLLFNRNGHIEKIAVAGGTPETINTGFANRCNNDHGISPDGRLLAVSDQSQEEHRSLVYVLPIGGGTPKRLTQNSPSYWHGWSPDGQTLAFVGERTGKMQIWRMHADGAEQEQVTSDEYNNWFPHISPDGKWMVFLSYDASVKGHPEDKDVMLRLMSLPDGKISVLAKLFGGQGTINVPSWSPDSKKLAFVSYQWLAH